VVTTPYGTDTKANGFTYVEAPTVSGVSPNAGPTGGGTSVTITGNYFTGTTVTFGGTPATSVSVVNGSTITCSTPAHAAGAVDVVVTTAGGSGTLTSGFTYYALPTVSSVTPPKGTVAGGTAVTVSGTNFYGPATVTFDASQASSVSVVNSTTIACSTPAHVAGPVTVTVTTPSGSGSQAAAYEYVDPPTLTDRDPIQGSTLGTTSVTLTGSNFYTSATVYFGAVLATSVTVVNGTTIQCVAPAQGVGVVDVSVHTGSGSATQTSWFTYIGQPTVSSVTPDNGSTAGGTPVTIAGTNFYATATVKFGAGYATSVNVVGTGAITCLTPSGSAGAVTVTVYTPYGSGSKTSAFTYYGVPTITSVEPAFGPAKGGEYVTITGTNFYTPVSASFGGSGATDIQVPVTTSIVCQTTSHAAGFVDVVVTTPYGTATKTSSYEFIGAPTIVSVTPFRGGTTTAYLKTVTVSGTNFYSPVSVSFTLSGLAWATNVSVLSRTVIQCKTPLRPEGFADVKVYTNAGETGTLDDAFEYISAPTVTSVTPVEGPTAGGTPVTITGTRFYEVATTNGVQFGGTAATSVSVLNRTTITCVTVTRAAATVNVTVTTPSGVGTKTSGYTYWANPTVSACEPTGGPTAGGTTVAVAGSNFYSPLAVSFGGVGATSVSIINAFNLSCVTPAYAIEGAVTVTVVTSSGTGSRANGFTYYAIPTVTGVNPSQGPSGGGTIVTISGTGFYNPLTISFGASASPSVSIVTASTITCITPAGTGLVDVRVATLSGTGTKTSGFEYFSPPTISAVNPSSGTTAGGDAVTIDGSGFFAPVSVTFGGNGAVSLSVVSTTQMTCTTPAHAAATVDVVATTSWGTGSKAGGFTYADPPTVSSVSPNQGPPGGGTAVTITGNSFVGPAGVVFGSASATSVSVVSITRITCNTPAQSAGLRDVSVSTPFGTGTRVDGFEYMDVPTVSGVSPVEGPAGGGQLVTVSGTNFYGTVSVDFGGAVATSPSVLSRTAIRCTTTAHAAGFVDVTVYTASGLGSKASAYEYIGPPTVSSVTPTVGPASGGTPVTIAGTNFYVGSPTVTFGGTPANSVSVVSRSTITCVTAARTAGLVDVTVTTLSGSGSKASAYEYIAAPTVTSVTPAAGAVAGGTAVTVAGTNFYGATSVVFDSSGATSILTRRRSRA
jgi:hypothetical protein